MEMRMGTVLPSGRRASTLAAVAADQATTLALQVALNVGVVAGAVGLGHQDGHVLAHHVLGAPAQDAFGRCVEGLHPPLRIDHHHAVHGRVGNGAQAGLALLHLQEHLPVAQADVDSDDQPPMTRATATTAKARDVPSTVVASSSSPGASMKRNAAIAT